MIFCCCQTYVTLDIPHLITICLFVSSRSNGTELKGIGCGPLFSSSGRKRKSGYNFPETPKKGNIEL